MDSKWLQVAASWISIETLVGCYLQVHARCRNTHFEDMALVLSSRNVTITETKLWILQTYLVFHWLTGCYNNKWTPLNLHWLGSYSQTVKNLHLLCSRLYLNQSVCKSSQVHARPGQTESKVHPSFQLESSHKSVWPGHKFFHSLNFKMLSYG